jgi:peptidoglycan/xylan/chitin deacetylase (PgdA/CDA1 family)
MPPADLPPRPVGRRTFLAAATMAVGALATACGDDGGSATSGSTTVPTAPGTPASTAPPTAPPSSPPPTARFVVSGPKDHDRVALTFHTNGDLGLVDQLLDVLARRQVHVTAFVVGDWLEANPDMAARIADGGHEFANHTYSHPTFGNLSRDGMLDEVVRCRDVLTRLTGGPGKFFRPSGTDDGTTSPGDVVLGVAAEAGYGTVLGFDVDPLDYDDPGADAVVQRTLAMVGAGSIVSLHFGHAGTVSALPAILDGIAQKGLAAGTASALLG